MFEFLSQNPIAFLILLIVIGIFMERLLMPQWMSTDAIPSEGTKFYYSSDGTTYTAFAEITSISGPDSTRDMIDVTDLDSTDGYRLFLGSFRQGGTVALDLRVTKTNLTVVSQMFESNTPYYYKIVCPDDEELILNFQGLLNRRSFEAAVGDVLKVPATITVSGPVEIATGSSSTSVLV